MSTIASPTQVVRISTAEAILDIAGLLTPACQGLRLCGGVAEMEYSGRSHPKCCTPPAPRTFQHDPGLAAADPQFCAYARHHAAS